MTGVRTVREAEVRALKGFVARVAEGPSGLVVEGEAGIGKTTLLWEAADRAAAAGMRVLSTRGVPSEVTYAFTAVADLLRDLGEVVTADLPAVQRAALERVSQGHGQGPSTDERIVAAAFLSVVERVTSRTPVLMCVDDAQWLDRSSRAVIAYAARRLSGRAGLMATVRTGDLNARDDGSWLSVVGTHPMERIQLRPLSFDDTHVLVRDRLKRTLPRPSIERVYRISKGNPFIAVELARSVDVHTTGGTVKLPRGLAALVRERIGDHDDEVGDVLLAAACAAAPSLELVGRATGNTAERVSDLLEPLETRNIVELIGNRVHFTHPLFATGAYTGVSRPRLRAMHRTLAGIVDQPEVKARHLALAAATADADTLAALDAAADATSAQGAQAVAAELVEMAIELGGDTPQRRIRAGELHFRAGSLVAARRHLDATLDEVPGGVQRALALMWLGAVRAYDDDLLGGAEAFAQAADEATDVPALRLLCLLRLAMALAMAGQLGEAIGRAEHAVEIADQLGLPGLRSQALSIWVYGRFMWGMGIDHGSLQTAIELEDPSGGASTVFQARAVEAAISAYTGDLARAETQMRAVRRRMHDHGTEVDLIWAANRLSSIAIWSGRYADATEAAQESLQRAEQIGGQVSLSTAWTIQAAVAAYTGRESDASAAATKAIDAARESGARELVKEPIRILAFLNVSLGDHAAAAGLLQPLLDDFDPLHGVELEEGSHLPNAIEALTRLGRVDEAEPLTDALERNGADRDRPWMLAVGARGRAEILAARGDLDAAVQTAERAMTHHDRLPMPFERARTQLLLGQLQWRRRDRSGAGANLRAALDVFTSLGCPPWVARTQAELTRLDTARDDDQLLTAAERRAAELAAAGLPNRDIAASLFLSEKTIEAHLSRVYRKLGVRSRTGLSAAMKRDDDQSP